MATGTEFCLLGPLVVRDGGIERPVRAGKQRAVLAALLLDAGRVVPVDELVETLWGAAPPPSARVTVQNYVMRLRKTLAGIGSISTHPHGYVMNVAAGELDVTRFENLLAEARAAARDGSWDVSAARAREALALWRGEPLADVDSELLALREVPRLAELRLQALEARIDADLRLGRHAEVIAELRQLITGHPLREHLRAQLMLALYRDGRQAEALAAYREARQVLAGELGAEPGDELRELHQRVLAADPDLAAPARPAGPRELPAPVAHFAGRAGELAALTRILDRPAGTVVISAIGGTAGVGKTALAVHWAHRVADRFPDGQLYVNLRGYDPGPPVAPADALAGFLRSLGVAGPDVPPGEAERAARYRSLLAGRKVLVVLDNAGSAEQVRPLLPGTASCAVLVTSRDALAGLVARDGAVRLDLDLLSLAESVGLLRTLIGERVDTDHGAAATLAGQCARLPLALRVAAELAAARPSVPLAELADELADQQRRLDLLAAGEDPRTAVRAVFSWSCRQLDDGTARAFRLLGLLPGPDLDAYAAAALTGTSLRTARQFLDRLGAAHLIQPTGPGRYGQHDLLRAYARELATAQEREEDRRAALTRLFDHYLCTAGAAMDTLFPAERSRRPALPPPAPPAPAVTDQAAARDWLDSHRASLVTVAAYAAGHGWPGHAIGLAGTVSRYLDSGGHLPDAILINTEALRVARRLGDHAAEAAAVANLGLADMQQGRFRRSEEQLQKARELFRETGDQGGEGRMANNLGNLHFLQGRYQVAAEYFQQSLVLQRKAGDRVAEGRALANIGAIHEKLGRYQEAVAPYRQSLALSRETGDRTLEARALDNLGCIDLRLGRYDQAAGHFRLAVAVARDITDWIGEAHALANLAQVECRQGRYPQAADHNQQALVLARKAGYRSVEAEALNGAGEILLATGRTGDALGQHATALSVATDIGDAFEQARAHDGLAQAHHALGDAGRARHHWQRALALYTGLGVPEAEEVRARLAYART